MERLRVVIADDDPLARELLELAVGRSEHVVVVASAADGWQAVAASDDADVVLLDATMPGPGLVETVREIRARRPEVAVVLVTGAASVDADRMADAADLPLRVDKGDVSGLLAMLARLATDVAS